MSSADLRRRQAGISALEAVVSVAMFSLMALVVERTLATTHDAERYLGAVRRATQRGQQIASAVHASVRSSRKLFGGDAVGVGYFDANDLARFPPAPGVRLPLIDETGAIGPDEPGDPRTGNALLYVRDTDPVAVVADPASGRLRYVDVYRFVCVYPHQSGRRVVSGDSQRALDLVVWRSVSFPSRADLLAIEDVVERTRIAAELRSRHGFTHVWDAGAPAASAFYALDVVGTVAALPTPGFVVPEDPAASDGGRLVYANAQLARTNAASAVRRPVFTAEDPATWAPNGFEVKITGASGSRKVWMHLVVETQSTRGRVAAHESTVIASTRDL
jgi:hypothetical protein